jgi:aspartate/methionine/tyrosine aminotransferase
MLDASTTGNAGNVRLSSRVERLRVPERVRDLGMPLGTAERELAQEPRPVGVLDLTYTDSRQFPPPEWALEEFSAAAVAGPTYTEYRGDGSVRRNLAPRLARFLGSGVDPDTELILTPGTQGALFAALSVLVEPGDRVALVEPDYLSTARTIFFLGGSVVPIPLVRDGGSRLIALDELEQAFASGVRLLVFSHPNNPTGAVLPPTTVAEIAALANRWDAVVLVDELYSRLIYDQVPFAHLRSERAMVDRCVTLLGPSKTESLSGYRIGLAVAPPHVVDAMEDVQAVMTLRAPAFSQRLLRRWLLADDAFVQGRVARFQRLRDLTLAVLATSSLASASAPGGGTYLLVEASGPGRSDQELVRRLLREAGLLVSPGYQFGLPGNGSFRLCFGQDEAVWTETMERMVNVIDNTNS